MLIGELLSLSRGIAHFFHRSRTIEIIGCNTIEGGKLDDDPISREKFKYYLIEQERISRSTFQ